MHFQLPPIADLDNAALRARLQHVLDHKTKPLGALGQLEALACSDLSSCSCFRSVLEGLKMPGAMEPPLAY